MLFALAIPALGMHTALPGDDSLPQDIAVMQTYDRIQAPFPIRELAATVVVEAEDVLRRAASRRVEQLETRARTTEELFEGALETDVSPDRTVATIDVPTAGDGTERRVERGAGRAARRPGPGDVRRRGGRPRPT